MSRFGRSNTPEQSPRSAEDRERARQEREARRAAREGRPAPPVMPLDDGTGDASVADEPRVEEPAVAEAPAPQPESPQPYAEDPYAGEPYAEEPDADEPYAEEPYAEEPRFEVDEPRVEEPPAEAPFEHHHAEDVEPRQEIAEPADLEPIEPAQPARFEPVEPAQPVSFDAPAPPEDDVVAEPVAQEPPAAAANEAGMGDTTASTSWFDDPAPTQASPPAPAHAGQETVEWDTRTPIADTPRDSGATEQWDVESALAADRQEPRVTRGVPARAATAAAASAAANTAGRSAGPRPQRPAYGDEDERPVAPRRVTRASRTLPPPPPPPGERRGKPGRRGRRLAVVAVLALIVAGGAWLYSSIYQPFAGDGGDRVTVRIPEQTTASDIGRILENEGVVASSAFFSLRSRLEGGDLKAGTYKLRRDMPYGAAIEALGAGPAPARVINVTLPEGRSRRETRAIVDQAGLRGSYLKASERSRGFRPSRYGAPRDVPSLEGFLFPATYELKPNATSRQLVRKQLEAFEENIGKVSMRRARAANLDVYDVLTIASMVERESTLAKERPIVASVIYNRLREGMPLGIDATIRFFERNWTRPLRVSELERDSPYNTRTRTGLPPGPIGSPGLASIRAAANPAKTDFLFYVVKPNGDGAHNFSATDAEFQRDVAAYNRERDRRGGQDPSSSDGG